MADDFQCGDVAVYIGVREKRWRGHPLRIGHLYRVVEIWPRDDTGARGLVIDGPPAPYTTAWSERAFRKLPKADERFAEQMRALKPHREKVPA